MLFTGFWAVLSAQEPVRFTTKQGLPTNNVYDMVEDSKGFMWFATKQGVVKFDGEKFKTFTIQDGLPNNDIWKLETDTQGRVWYFTKSTHLGYIQNDKVYKFPNTENAVISPNIHNKINDTLFLHTNIGMLTLKDSVFVYEYDKKTINQKNKTYRDLYPDIIRSPYYFPKGKNIVFTKDNRIIIIDEPADKTHTIRHRFSGDPLFPYVHFLDGKALIFTFRDGVIFFDTNTFQQKTIHFKDLIGQDKTEEIRVRILDNHFQISGSGFLLIFDYDQNLKKRYLFDTDERSVWSFQDSRGNIWQSSLRNGITLIPNTQLQSQYYLSDEKVEKTGFIGNQFFVGVQHKGFYQWDNQKEAFFKKNEHFSTGNIYQIKKDVETQKSFLVSERYGYELENGKLTPIVLPNFINSPKETLFFKDIILFKDRYYFVSSSAFGYYNRQNPNDVFYTSVSGFLQLTVFKNQVYVSGSDGLYVFENDELVKPKNDNDLLSVAVNTVTYTKDRLLVGTDGRGVYFYDENNVDYLPETDGLSVQRVLKEADTLWLATQKGVKKILLNNNDLTQSQLIDAFYESDGLLQNNTNDIHKDGDFLYASSDIGLTRLHLNSQIYKQLPKVYFKTASDTISYANSDRNNISIDFGLQSYTNQEHTTFAYRLLPLYDQWTTSSVKTLNFSNLPPKLYTLEVKAIDQHNNQNIIRQYIKIIPVWWETTLAKTGFALLFLLGIYLSFLYIKKRVQKKEQEKARQEKRVAGLELQALRSQMNPHFVHNSLNAIQYFVQRNEVELSENYLSKFSQLIRLFFEYSRRQTIAIKEELELLTNYLEIEKLRFEDKLEYEISVCETIDTDEQQIPSMLLQPIVENAVNHGVFHKKGQGKVGISFKQTEDNGYEVTVKDNGIGINKSKSLFKASSKNYQSNSSKVLHERLDLLNKSNEWKVNYQIQDLSEIDETQTGTMVKLTFKQLV